MNAGIDESVKRLLRLDCCAVSDAMDKLSLPGSVTGLSRWASSKRIAGRVVTCRLVRAIDAPSHAGAIRHLGTTAIESAHPGTIIVIEQRTGIDAACWGGILSLGAKVRGIAGIIADGPVRDIDEARTYDFPVFARGLTARTARGRVKEQETNGPVTIGDITVHPGDYAIADAGGVVFVQARDIERVLDAAESIANRESAMAKELLGGKAITQVMNTDYEHMLHSPRANSVEDGKP